MVKMARRRYAKRRGGHRSKKVPLGATMGLIAPLIPVFTASGTLEGKMNYVVGAYTGYDMVSKTWSAENMKRGLVPLAAGVGVSMLASKMKVNRYLAAVPFIKL